MYKNYEGYADPTAGAALGKVMKEYRIERRREWQRQNSIKERQKVYIVSPYAGDVEINAKNAITYCRYAISKKKIPIASHLLYPQILDDNNPEEREVGTLYGLSLLAICDEIWCFGDELSPGMEKEIKEAKRLKKRIRYFPKEVTV